MAGQTINDRLLAAKHSLAGQGLAKSVCKATTEELLGPKKKHLDYLVHCTNEPNVSIPQMANLLIERSQNTNWVVVYKALITTHHVMCYGNERFTQYLASSNSSFNLANFVDKGTAQGVNARTGYDMSPFIRRYAKYLNEKAMSYRMVAFDFCKVKRGKEEGTLRTMNAEKLLKTLPTLQSQLDALLEFDCTANDLTNGVINMCFMLLFRDLIRLFACYNDGVINLLEKYFDMSKKQCRDALDLYKKFLIRMDRVGEFLKVAEQIGIDKGDIPDLTKAPNSLLDALEQHLNSLEGNTPTNTKNEKSIKSGVSALSTTSSAFGTSIDENIKRIDDTLKQQALAEEDAMLNQFKAKVQSPPSGTAAAATNPFLTENEPILDLFAPNDATNQKVQSSKASDDLLQLGNPFADMWSASNTTTEATNQPINTMNDNIWPQSQPPITAPLTSNTMFDTQSSPFQTLIPAQQPSLQQPVLQQQQQQQPLLLQQQQPQQAQPTKVLTGDLESSLASLAENLTISSNWNSPKMQKNQSGMGQQMSAVPQGVGQPQIMGVMPQQMGAPMMMANFYQPMSSPRMQPPQQQQQQQQVNFDPFGDL